MVAEDVSSGSSADAALPERMRVLLIEDDDGDALLVEELLSSSAGLGHWRMRARHWPGRAACCLTWSSPTPAG